jgi:hypothetical protein
MNSTRTRRITVPAQRQPVLSLFLPLFDDDRTSTRGVVRGSTSALVFRLSPFFFFVFAWPAVGATFFRRARTHSGLDCIVQTSSRISRMGL